MRWPWRRNEGNRHQWETKRRDFRRNGDQLYVPGTLLPDDLYEADAWVCSQCGETHKKYCGLGMVIPPEFGCTALPIPAPPRGEQDTGFPVVATGGEG